MGQSVRMVIAAAVVGVLGVSGCGPCRCADGTQVPGDISAQECFQTCGTRGSYPTNLVPVPDPNFSADE